MSSLAQSTIDNKIAIDPKIHEYLVGDILTDHFGRVCGYVGLVLTTYGDLTLVNIMRTINSDVNSQEPNRKIKIHRPGIIKVVHVYFATLFHLLTILSF